MCPIILSGCYFAGGCGEGEACGAGCWAGCGDPAGAGVAAGVGAGGDAAAACCGGCAAGLIQQAWMWLFSEFGTFGSIWGMNRVKQRNAAWMWPPGQPKRS